MRLLLDTHAFFWWFANDPRLPASTRLAIAHADVVFASAVTAWGISTKHRTGKWPEAAPVLANYEQLTRDAGFSELPLAVAHGLLAGTLPGPHRDPFDRILMAQSRLENAVMVTRDRVFSAYGVETLWG